MSDSPFLLPPAVPQPRRYLVGVPFAGGGVGIFRTWQAHAPADVEVLPVQLPGRERRLRDRPYTRMAALIADLAPAVAERVGTTPWIAFGHSLGGAIAYELALALRRMGRPPAALIVSARRAPGVPLPHPPLFALPDDRLVTAVEAHYGPFPAVLRSHPGLLATFLPTLRADLQLLDTWTPTVAPPLDCPVTVLRGDADATTAPDQVAGWADVTTGPFAEHVLPGGHFFVRDADDARDLVLGRLLPPA